MTEPQKYSAKDIQVITGLEHIRRRHEMYVGKGDQAILALYTAALEWAAASAKKNISVKAVVSDNLITVSHDGDGISIEEHSHAKKPILELMFTQLPCGGQAFDLPVINALSECLTVDTCWGDPLQHYTATFRCGQLTGLWSRGAAKDNKTTVSFHPDLSILAASSKLDIPALVTTTDVVLGRYPHIDIDFDFKDSVR